MSLVESFTKSSLDKYRKNATFDEKKMKLSLFSEEDINFQTRMYNELQKHPILFPVTGSKSGVEEIKRISALKTLKMSEIRKLFENDMSNSQVQLLLLSLTQLDASASIQSGIASRMFSNAIRGIGTERHLEYCNEAVNGKILGAFCLTEVGHGSDAKLMKTTAIYDENAKEFILHTPNFEAAKCWSGNIGKLATHGIVYAQLITPNHGNHGLHAFVVKLRDPKTLLPYPGVILADLGEKIGLEGIDNGLLIFNNYRIPRTDLLNKLGDVNEEGNYIAQIADVAKQYAISLGVLSQGRIGIIAISSNNISHAVAIAVRFTAVRKQFRSDPKEEKPLLEYQTLLQNQLLHSLSVAYISHIFSTHISSVNSQFLLDSDKNESTYNLNQLGVELHAISSVAKSAFTWLVRDCIRECKEACGDHAYLIESGLDDLGNNHDANCTYEGDNNVLIQQTGNWLLKIWDILLKRKTINFPLSSVNFLNNASQILTWTFNTTSSLEDFVNPRNMLNYYQWLIAYLLKRSYEKHENLIKTNQSNRFWAKNESQVYFCKNLSLAYLEHYVIQEVHSKISKVSYNDVRSVLNKLLSLYGVSRLEKHLTSFYQGGFANGSTFANCVGESISMLSKNLKDDVVLLSDVLAPPDFFIKSVLGHSDGQMYQYLEDGLVQRFGAFSKPHWWMEISNRKNTISKL